MCWYFFLFLRSLFCVDCFLHHMLWQDYRVVLLVPLNAFGGVKVRNFYMLLDVIGTHIIELYR